MRFPVRVIRILIGVEVRVGMFRCQLARHPNGAIGTVRRIGINDVRSIALHDLLALPRNVLGHAERHRKTFRCSQHGIGDSSIAAGRIQQNSPGIEQSTSAGFGDNAGSRAILHRAAGVVPFSLAQKCHALKIASNRVQPQKRGISDPLHQAVTKRFAQSRRTFPRFSRVRG